MCEGPAKDLVWCDWCLINVAHFSFVEMQPCCMRVAHTYTWFNGWKKYINISCYETIVTRSLYKELLILQDLKSIPFSERGEKLRNLVDFKTDNPNGKVLKSLGHREHWLDNWFKCKNLIKSKRQVKLLGMKVILTIFTSFTVKMLHRQSDSMFNRIQIRYFNKWYVLFSVMLNRFITCH